MKYISRLFLDHLSNKLIFWLCEILSCKYMWNVHSCQTNSDCNTYRKLLSLTELMSTPSNSIWPWFSSTIRNRARNNEDFPEPVRPTMPTLSPGNTSKLTPSRALGKPGRYANTAPTNSTLPFSGHESRTCKWYSFRLRLWFTI